MEFFLTSLVWLLAIGDSYGYSSQQTAPEREYIEAWKKFHPSQAVDQGIHSALFDYEDLSTQSIRNWVELNKRILDQLSDQPAPHVANDPINARLLRMQIRRELDRWEREAPHRHSLALYAGLIGNAVEPVLQAEYLTAPERTALICGRLDAVQQLCESAVAALVNVSRNDLAGSLEILDEAAEFFAQKLPQLAGSWLLPAHCRDLADRSAATADKIRSLIVHATTQLLPQAAEADPILGPEEYARQLSLYTDSPLTPEALAGLARAEIEAVRKLMGEVSREYLQKAYPDRAIPENYDTLVGAALADMEKDAPKNGEEYLQFWQDLSAAAIQFIEDKQIATLPKYQTLQITPAPESAGAAARIGWVESAPPFAPNPLTTLYLPSIPDSFPEQERIDFWSSFNKPFNRMIVIHELFPGHYMQIKISRETPHPVRLLFPYGPYFEGWATFCERVVLDAGWERDRPLTFLAHLRKRLENANRAYTSVQVHCNGWDQEQVMKFSTETSLLAPQFAKSLWGRLMSSPMQMTSYFLGRVQFAELLAAEQERLGPAFKLKEFMDTILRAGPIPVEEFKTIFEATFSR